MALAPTEQVPAEIVDIDGIIQDILNPPDPEADAKKARAEQLATLASKIQAGFIEAYEHRHKTGVTTQLEDCWRLYKGEYEAALLTKIREYGGSELYFNLIASKADNLAAWIQDTLKPETYEPELEPTPVADLSPGDMAGVERELLRQMQEDIALSGQRPGQEDIEAVRVELIDQRAKEVQALARKKADAHVAKIKDQYEEGGFPAALTEFVDYLKIFPTAYLMREIKIVRRARWGQSGALDVTEEPAIAYSSPDPRDMYPGPNVATLNDGPLFRTFNIRRTDLAKMRGKEGWNGTEIDAALEGPAPSNARSYVPDEITRARNENRDTLINEGLPAGTLCGVQAWMEAPDGTGFNEGDQIKALLIGTHCVYSGLNPDPLGRIPCKCTSFKKNVGTVHGIAVAMRGKATQQAANACARNLIDNLAFGSGPMVGIDADTVDGAEKITFTTPRQVFVFHSSRLRNAATNPIQFFQPDCLASLLQSCHEFYAGQMDNETLVPRFWNGNGATRGAGETASGMSMLMDSSAKGLRTVIANIVLDVLRPDLAELYLWNLKYLPDDEWSHIKGDLRVKSIDPLMIMAREINSMRRQEFMNAVSVNENMMRVVQDDGLAEMMRQVADRLQFANVVPTKEAIAARPMMAPMLPAPGNQGTPPALGTEPAAPVAPPMPMAQAGPDLMPAGGGHAESA